MKGLGGIGAGLGADAVTRLGNARLRTAAQMSGRLAALALASAGLSSVALATLAATADAAAAPVTLAFTSQAPTSATVGGASYTPTASASTSSGSSTDQTPSFTIGAGTTDAACALSNGVVTFAHAGTCVIDAQVAADANYSAASGLQTFTVAPAPTTTTLVVGVTSQTATVAAGTPGGGTPAGSVVFSVGGRVIGSASLVNGVANLSYSVPPNVTEAILASYEPAGGDYTTSSATVTVNGPDIQPTFVARPTVAAVLTSATPRNRRGWYHTRVRVHFICNGAGAPVLGGCPTTLVLYRSGANVRVTRTIATTAGRRATVTLRGIKIDLTRPHVVLRGVRSHALYAGQAPRVSCAASDRISGIRSCRVVTRVSHRSTLEAITYTATAVSWAGTVARTSVTVYAKP
jgi:hypothetical protein